MPNPMHDKQERTHVPGEGGGGKTPVTTACPEAAEDKTCNLSYELSWTVKVTMKNIIFIK